MNAHQELDAGVLEDATERFLRRRSWLNPDLRLLRWGGGFAVAKDWGDAPFLLRAYGRWGLGREWKLLKKVEGLQGVPRPLARSRDAIVMTYLDGIPLSGRLTADLVPDFFPLLEDLLAAIHGRGVVHLDLRQRRNVLFGADGRPRILDFGAGLDLQGFGWIGRFALRWLGYLDRMAVLKLKANYAPDRLTEREKRRAFWAKASRYFWPPNWVHVFKTRIRRAWRKTRNGP